MARRGKLIALEGIDGSGKSTQLGMLVRSLQERNLLVSEYSFPRYDHFFGKQVARFLNGKFGPLASIDPHFSALLYAGDRWQAKPEIEADLQAGRMVITDRYVGSNLAHQTARMTRAFRKDFLAWLKELEYQVYGMPAEDLVIYLRSPVELAHRLAGSRRDREYTNMDRDLAESDLKHLEAASEAYDYLALQPNWLRIECYDGVERHLHTPKEIHDQVIAAVEKRILSALEASA